MFFVVAAQFPMSPFGVFRDPVFHFNAEPLFVPLVVLGRLDVEGVVEVEQVREEGTQTPDDVFQTAGRSPPHAVDGALPQDAQADVAFFADVRVPKSGQALHLRGRDVVVVAYVDVEPELAAHPEPLVGCDD